MRVGLEWRLEFGGVKAEAEGEGVGAATVDVVVVVGNTGEEGRDLAGVEGACGGGGRTLGRG